DLRPRRRRPRIDRPRRQGQESEHARWFRGRARRRPYRQDRARPVPGNGELSPARQHSRTASRLPEVIRSVQRGPMPRPLPTTVDAALSLLGAGDYVADRSLATALFLALRRSRPLFLEGEAGVGKTEIAKVLATTLGRRLVRLQ